MIENHGARILVVDDDSDLVESYRQVLEMAGYAVATALSGEAALGLARDDRPDVVLTDVSMPNMDGFELILRLKDVLGQKAPPVVVCSAFDMTEEEAMARGAEVFLQKPASASALVQSVEALCLGERPDKEAMLSERSNVQRERLRQMRGSELRLRDVDHAELAREIEPWLDWFRRYFDCGSAGMFLLESGAVLPLVVLGAHMSSRPEPRLLHVTLAAGVETGTSLVVGDMATHPSFRRALGQRIDIASFAGVPLVTTDGIRIGALCLADSLPNRLDSDSLLMMEHLGRRAVTELFDRRSGSLRSLPMQPPLLLRRTFDMLLASELKSARRGDQSVEVAIATLEQSVSAGSCAEQMWRDGPAARMAIGSWAPGEIAMFVRGTSVDARRHVAESLDRARAQKLLDAAGIASVAASAGLSRSSVLEIAESALSVARAGTGRARVERIVVRPEPSGAVA